MGEILTPENFDQGLNILISRDRDLAEVFKNLGKPPLWIREPGFSTLVQIILEQQVSLASAKAVFERLQTAISPITPEKLIKLDDIQLKSIGFSRQKSRYVHLLAESIIAGELDLNSLNTMSDEEVRKTLKKYKGIGDWTVDIYLLMVLKRLDALPKGDLGLILAIQEIKNLDKKPTPQEIEEISDSWKPYRSIATRLLWHYYLNK
ncbi:MAG: DNA-3-methyladenine glycosylase family protein [Mastigocoleus sp.]